MKATITLPPGKSVMEPDGLSAFPAMFAREYLTWQPDDPDERGKRLKPFIASSLDRQVGWSGSDSVGQKVLQVWAYSVEPVSETRWLVTVAARVAPYGATGPVQLPESTLFLAVPVAATRGGGLTVYDYPSLVPAPRDPSYNEPLYRGTEKSDPDGTVKALLTDFFKAYFSGEETAYFLLPGTTVRPLRSPWTFTRISRQVLVMADDGEWAIVDVSAKDPVTQAEFTYRYTLKLGQLQERWMIADMQQKGE